VPISPRFQPNLSIEKVQTGPGFAGGRVAVLFAPSNAPAGSLSSLTEFFEANGIHAVPGYSGDGPQHVLRLAGFTSDTQLRAVLTEALPDWIHEQQQRGRPVPSISTESLGKFTRLKPDELPAEQSAVKRFLKQNSGILTGISYTAGDVGMLIAGMLGKVPTAQEGKVAPDIFRTMAGGGFFTANAVRMVFTSQQGKPRPLHQVIEEAADLLDKNDDWKNNAAVTKATQKHLDSAHYFLQQYPWEIASALGLLSTGLYATSSLKRHNYRETLSSLGAITAMAIPIVVPEKGGHSLFDLGENFVRPDGRTFIDSWQDFADNHTVFRPFINAAISGVDYLQEKPLTVSAMISGVSNANAAYSNIKKASPDYASAGANSAWLVGNYFQGISSKGRGAGFDDIVSMAANYIENHPDFSPNDETAFNKQVERLSLVLAEQSEIIDKAPRIAHGIRQRLSYREENPTTANAAERFIASERSFINDSPFIARSAAQKILTQRAQKEQLSTLR
jgi:hypothetical protein